MTFKIPDEAPKTVDELRNHLYFGVGSITSEEVDDILEYIFDNKALLEEWAKDYLA